jgi:hypothetical protein
MPGQTVEHLTKPQRAVMRAAVRAHAKKLGYTEGMERHEMSPSLRELLLACQKLPIWENPEQGYKATLPPSTERHKPAP